MVRRDDSIGLFARNLALVYDKRMATDISTSTIDRPRRFHFEWLFPALFRPRATFARIAEQTSDVWFTPLLVLMAAALLNVAVAGPLKQAAAQTGQNLPDAAQWWTAQQLQQYQQIQGSMNGPVFIYVFPVIINLLSIWVGWLALVGILHLALTLLGGRGNTRAAMNVVAWANLPFAVRELVRAGAMLASRQLIARPGLTGFAPTAPSTVNFMLAALLALVDIYLIWHIVLLVVGVRAGNGLPRGKAIGGVLIAVALMLLLQALPSFLGAQFSELSIIQPFF
jgi:hypothetical protein